MSRVIAVAGGSGGLGRALVEALKSNDAYKTYVFSRKANPTLEKEIGVTVLQADYSNVGSLTQLLQEHKIDTVISSITNYDNSSSPEEQLIAAAERSSATRRYIPSVWSGFDYTPEQAGESPIAASRLALLTALQKSPLEWAAIFPGIFLDFYALGIPSHVPNNALAIDIQSNAASIPGDGNYPVYLTHTTDIAKYTVALLGLDRWQHKKYFLYGDTKTWNEVVAIAEAAKGVKFDVAYDDIEKLKAGVMTALPGHEPLYQIFGSKEVFQLVMAKLSVYMAQGEMVYEKPLLNTLFPDIKAISVQDALQQKSLA